jgi:predicted metal-binding membrane protein
MTFTHHFRQRLTVCVAIVAVLLLFVAPIVSKTLMERQAMPQHSMMDSSMSHHEMDMPMAGMSHHMMDEGEFACGYCDLLVHVPLLMWVFTPFIWLIMVISRAPPLPHVVAPIVRRFSGIHRPRAPPARLPC